MSIQKLAPLRLITLSFLMTIVLGAVLLCLPFANNGRSLSFFDALFTACSATCVTGLVVVDTATQFNFFGQFILLCLIQIGGLGCMVVFSLFAFVLKLRIGLKERALLAEATAALGIGGVVRLVRLILFGTALIEGIGAIVLAFRFVPMFGLLKGLWYAVFHAVSAFCNAGFDLMGTVSGSFSSLSIFSNDPLVLLTIAVLIILGGLGFIVWNDVFSKKLHWHKFSLHSKAVLGLTVFLLVSATFLFYVLEFNNSLKAMPLSLRWLNAFFQAVTPRTAGFNSLDLGSLTSASQFLTSFLMFIGAAPGGTGGGVKLTTFLVVLVAMHAELRQQAYVNVANFQLKADLVRRAFSSTFIYLFAAFSGIFMLLLGNVNLSKATFEAFSALGTVGLSLGLTPSLGSFNRLVLMLLMFIGRVGSLTFFLNFYHKQNINKLQNPIGQIVVG